MYVIVVCDGVEIVGMTINCALAYVRNYGGRLEFVTCDAKGAQA